MTFATKLLLFAHLPQNSDSMVRPTAACGLELSQNHGLYISVRDWLLDELIHINTHSCLLPRVSGNEMGSNDQLPGSHRCTESGR